MLLAAGKGSYQPLDAASLSDEEAAAVCRRVLQATKAQGWQIGKTRVFLRAGQLALLEVRTRLPVFFSPPTWVSWCLALDPSFGGLSPCVCTAQGGRIKKRRAIIKSGNCDVLNSSSVHSSTVIHKGKGSRVVGELFLLRGEMCVQ